MAKIYDFVAKSAAEHREDYLRTLKVGLISRGVPNPNILPGSDEYARADALANELAVISANTIIKVEDVMPDSAEGDDLARIAAVYGLTKQGAAGSVGAVILSSSQSTTVTTGQELIDEEGLRYAVTLGGTYVDGDVIPIAAVDTGERTNRDEGDNLRWTSSPAFADEGALVAPGGLTNGIDEENDEVLRQRLLAYLRNPPKSGNWEYVAELAEASSPSVQKAAVYPAIQGGATFHVAVWAAPTASNKSRVVAGTTLSGTITPYVQGQMPEHAYSVVTSVTDVNADVAFGLILPDAPTAVPPGGGGGWLDGTPWPNIDGTSTFRVRVSSVTNTTNFVVDAVTAPQVGISRIAWLSPYNWTLYTAKVTASTGSSGAYTITIDNPFPGITAGCYIWPNCLNAQAYVDTVLESFAMLGPGEKTTNTSALLRGFRHPKPGTAWPSQLGGFFLRNLTADHEEVEASQYYHRTDGTTTVTGTAGQVTPQVPGSVTDPPKIFVPRHIAFYRVP